MTRISLSLVLALGLVADASAEPVPKVTSGEAALIDVHLHEVLNVDSAARGIWWAQMCAETEACASEACRDLTRLIVDLGYQRESRDELNAYSCPSLARLMIADSPAARSTRSTRAAVAAWSRTRVLALVPQVRQLLPEEERAGFDCRVKLTGLSSKKPSHACSEWKRAWEAKEKK
jgi:hypothetical protein